MNRKKNTNVFAQKKMFSHSFFTYIFTNFSKYFTVCGANQAYLYNTFQKFWKTDKVI